MSATGEYPAAQVEIGERTRVGLPLVWLWPIAAVVMALGAGGWAIRAQAEDVAALKRAERDHDSRIQRVEDSYQHIRAGIDDIKRELRRRDE